MKKITIFLLALLAGCQKGAPKEEAVKKPELAIPLTTQQAATGQTPAESLEEAKKVAEAAQANLDEKGADMDADQ